MNVPIAPTIPASQNLTTLTVDSINVVNTVVISGNNTSNVGLDIINKHIKIQQTVPPTVSSGSVINATDVVGIITFTSTGLAGIQTVLTFDSVYESAPIVQLTPRNVNAAVNTIGYFVTSTISGFTINAAFTTASVPFEYYYTVIQSN